MSLGISKEELREAQAAMKKRRPPPHPHELVKIAEGAELCDLNAQTIRRWIRERRIPAYGWRGSLWVRLADLLPEVETKPPTMPKVKR